MLTTLSKKLKIFGASRHPQSFWMRNVGGQAARIANLSEPGIVCFTVGGSDKHHKCSVEEWNGLPVWGGHMALPGDREAHV